MPKKAIHRGRSERNVARTLRDVETLSEARRTLGALFNIPLGLTLIVYSVSVAALYEKDAHLERQEHECRGTDVGHIG